MMTLFHHWHELGVIGLVVAALAALQIFLPGVLPACLKWIIGTEWGRALLVIVAVSLGWWWFRDHYIAVGRADLMAEQKAATARAQLTAANKALTRDKQSDTATDTARATITAQASDHDTRAARVEGIAHAPRPVVPAVCPAPDPDLMRELGEGTDRLHAAEGRLRGQ